MADVNYYSYYVKYHGNAFKEQLFNLVIPFLGTDSKEITLVHRSAIKPSDVYPTTVCHSQDIQSI